MRSLTIATITLSLLSVNLLGSNSQEVGIGKKQSQNMGKGMILGSILGGVLGNQKNKSVEGVLIGGTIGAIIGSEIGKGKDYRQSQTVKTHSTALYTKNSQHEARTYPSSYSKPATYSSGSSDEVINARSDAEMAEAELRLLETKIREKQRKERLLNEYRMRESIARQRIMDLQANQIHNH